MPKIDHDALAGVRLVPLALLAAVFWLTLTDFAAAHHVLGRPSYSLGEDSNTPSSLQAEARVGDYYVTYMVFPAFPKPNSPGRINLYVKSLKTGKSFDGKIYFTVRDDSWKSWIGLGAAAEKLGSQVIDDFVYRQGFSFQAAGDYIITAHFKGKGAPYVIDFPLRIGAPSPWGPIGLAALILMVLLVGVSIVQRRRAMTAKLRDAHQLSDRPV